MLLQHVGSLVLQSRALAVLRRQIFHAAELEMKVFAVGSDKKPTVLLKTHGL